MNKFPEYFKLPESDIEIVAWGRIFGFAPFPEVFINYEMELGIGYGQRAYNMYVKEIKHLEKMMWNQFIRENNLCFTAKLDHLILKWIAKLSKI